jgi:HemY protein
MMARQLWGKARALLEQAARDDALAPTVRREAWLHLAAMAEQDRDEERAAQCFRAAASLG